MPSHDTPFFDRLQAVFNVLVGVTDTRSLPYAFRAPAPWEIDPEALQRPAIWRRTRRVR
ncbi:hypothetical protein [Accumulibacter sp.]|uniref:hypothetical protein n=1 Tax=Accumulibacter sp. TaxID=2053492 RepID=UPI001A47E0A9|nr:hypothetical protein [Accumulibacter sp.]MBL8374074.1 hypothetical protein [Accumulibacter sp.]